MSTCFDFYFGPFFFDYLCVFFAVPCNPSKEHSMESNIKVLVSKGQFEKCFGTTKELHFLSTIF